MYRVGSERSQRLEPPDGADEHGAAPAPRRHQGNARLEQQEGNLDVDIEYFVPGFLGAVQHGTEVRIDCRVGDKNVEPAPPAATMLGSRVLTPYLSTAVCSSLALSSALPTWQTCTVPASTKY